MHVIPDINIQCFVSFKRTKIKLSTRPIGIAKPANGAIQEAAPTA